MNIASMSLLLILFSSTSFASKFDFMGETEKLVNSGVLKKASSGSTAALESYRSKLIQAKVDNTDINYLAYSSALLVLDRADLKQAKHLVCRDLEAKAKQSFRAQIEKQVYPSFTWPILKVVEQICE
ncbi:MAG: hypothetical protein VX642_09210 [Bdellovibrionota bacterium]|nr:hypothetical protein [Bdellovibrionota bacterium]